MKGNGPRHLFHLLLAWGWGQKMTRRSFVQFLRMATSTWIFQASICYPWVECHKAVYILPKMSSMSSVVVRYTYGYPLKGIDASISMLYQYFKIKCQWPAIDHLFYSSSLYLFVNRSVVQLRRVTTPGFKKIAVIIMWSTAHLWTAVEWLRCRTHAGRSLTRPRPIPSYFLEHRGPHT